MANPVTLAQAASFLTNDALKWSAWGLRDNAPRPAGEGVQNYQAWRVMSRQAGANMSVDVGVTGVGLMEAWVRGDTRGGQGLYRVDNIDRTAPTASTYVTQVNVSVTNNGSANPRLDVVVLEVVDLEHIGGGSATAQVRVIAGTATAAASLDNRSGAPSIPVSALHLADILVPALESTSIDPGDIRDRRAFNLHGVTSGLTATGTADRVTFIPAPGLRVQSATNYTHTLHDLMQSAALMYLPRSITGATHLYWKYLQGSTATAGTYSYFVADTSGRVIASTSSVAFAGTASTYQVRDESISWTLDAGLYFVGMCWDSSAGNGLTFLGTQVDDMLVGSQGLLYRSSSGGATVPSTILGYTDAATLTSATSIPGVPIFTIGI